LVLGAVYLLPIVANLSAARTVGVNWVGRYSLPLAVGVPVLAGMIAQRQRVPRRVAAGIAVVAVLVLVGIQAIALATLLQRYVVGNQAAFWSFLGATNGWQPPIGVRGAVALGAAALAVAAALLMVALWPRVRQGAPGPRV